MQLILSRQKITERKGTLGLVGLHDKCGSKAFLKQVTHRFHVGFCVAEKHLVALAEAVEPFLVAFGGKGKTVLGAFSVTEEKIATALADARQLLELGCAEKELPLVAPELGKGRLRDVSQPILGIDKMVTAVYVTVMLDNKSVAACLAEGAKG